MDATCGRSGKSHCAKVHSTLLRLVSYPLTPHPAAHPSSEPTGSPTPQKSTGAGLGVWLGSRAFVKHVPKSCVLSPRQQNTPTKTNKQTNQKWTHALCISCTVPIISALSCKLTYPQDAPNCHPHSERLPASLGVLLALHLGYTCQTHPTH